MSADKRLHVSIKSDFAEIKDAWHKIADLLKSLGLSSDDLFDIHLSAEEAMVNAVKYGNKFDPKLFVDITVSCNGREIKISVKDQGKGFDYAHTPDPTTNENIAKASGRGVYLINKLMDEVHYNKEGNEIIMVKFIKNQGSR
ncbi:MAG: ATP-binding protein [Candidatus Omnitrophota bacterium]